MDDLSWHIVVDSDKLPTSLMDSTWSLKVKTMEGEGIGACSLACSTLRVKEPSGASKWD